MILKRLELPKYSRNVSFAEIEKNEFNLNIPRYIDSQQAEDIQDIEGHLRGGIPNRDVEALEKYWKVLPNLKAALFAPLRDNYSQLFIPNSNLKQTIYKHAEFVTFINSMNALFAQWREGSAATLKGLPMDCQPKQVIVDLAENLLAHYTGKPLIGKYDVYQHLMDYWAEVMQDDCYLIAADGWKAETSRVLVKNAKGNEIDKGWTCDLIPKSLIVARYFNVEWVETQNLASLLETITAQISELEEEHGGEEGAFAELDKINKATVTAQLRVYSHDVETQNFASLREWLTLYNRQTDLKRDLKIATDNLDALAYANMDTEIAALETKLAKVREIKQGMMHNLLTGRIRLIGT